MILIGDVMQIEPIVGAKEETVMGKFYPTGPFFFNSKSYDKKDFKQLELTKIFRQSDKKFIDLLNKIRLNKINSEDLDELNNQVKEDVDNGVYDSQTRLFLATIFRHSGLPKRAIEITNVIDLPKKEFIFY